MQFMVPIDFSKRAEKGIAFATDLHIQTGLSMLPLHILPNAGPTLGRVTTGKWKLKKQQLANMVLQNFKPPSDLREKAISANVIHEPTVAEAHK